MENFIQNELFLEASLFMFQTILRADQSTVQSCHLLGVTVFRNWIVTTALLMKPRGLFFQQIIHPVDQTQQRSHFCVLSYHLCSPWWRVVAVDTAAQISTLSDDWAFWCPANVHVNMLHGLWSAIQPYYGGNDSQYAVCSVFGASSFLIAQGDWWLLFRHAWVRSVLLVLSPTGCRDLSGLWTEKVCWESSVLCPVTLEIELVRCPWRLWQLLHTRSIAYYIVSGPVTRSG